MRYLKDILKTPRDHNVVFDDVADTLTIYKWNELFQDLRAILGQEPGFLLGEHIIEEHYKHKHSLTKDVDPNLVATCLK